MSIKAAVHHLTHYRYDRPVTLGPQVIRLRPAPHSKTRVISHSLKVEPSNHFVNIQQDPYGNYLARFVFPEPVRELRVEVDLVADMTVYNPFDFFVEPEAETWPFSYPEDLRDDLSIYLKPEPATPLLQAFLDSIDRSGKNTVDFVVDLALDDTQLILVGGCSTGSGSPAGGSLLILGVFGLLGLRRRRGMRRRDAA